MGKLVVTEEFDGVVTHVTSVPNLDERDDSFVFLTQAALGINERAWAQKLREDRSHGRTFEALMAKRPHPEQNDEKIIEVLRKKLHISVGEAHSAVHESKSYSLNNGAALWFIDQTGLRLVVPEGGAVILDHICGATTWRQRMIFQAHNELGAHTTKGRTILILKLALRVYWDKMEKEVAEYCDACPLCKAMRGKSSLVGTFKAEFYHTPNSILWIDHV
jgi:hypothetical protein